MLEEHLQTLEDKLKIMDKLKVVAFAMSCLNRQVVLLERYEKFDSKGLSNELINHYRNCIDSFGGDAIAFKREEFDKQIMKLQEDSNEYTSIPISIIGNLIDFIEAYAQMDNEYFVEYGGYRNFSLLDEYEEEQFYDVEFEFDKKPLLMKELYQQEIKRQLSSLTELEQISSSDFLKQFLCHASTSLW